MFMLNGVILCAGAACQTCYCHSLVGVLYAYPIFYGLLFVLHVLLLLVFSVAMLRNKEWLLSLQLCILAVIILGLLEVRLRPLVLPGSAYGTGWRASHYLTHARPREPCGQI